MSSLLNLLLVRHGLTDWNEEGRLMGRVNIGLNSRGRAQVASLVESLRGLPIARVLSSPQQRALETATPIAEALGLGVETDPEIDEVWLGRWQGKTIPELRGDPDLERYLEDPTYECDAIESTVRVQERVVAVTERLRANKNGQALLLVSHGDPLRLILAHYLAMGVANYRRFVVDNASVSVLRFSRHEPRLVRLNWLPGDGRLAEALVP
jgi:broad specificity phosphatase PhoE